MNKMVRTYCESVARQEGLYKVSFDKVLVDTYFLCEVYNTETDTNYGHKWLTLEDMRQMRLANSDVDYIELDNPPRDEYKDIEVREVDWEAVYNRLSDDDIEHIKKYGFTEADFNSLNLHVIS